MKRHEYGLLAIKFSSLVCLLLLIANEYLIHPYWQGGSEQRPNPSDIIGGLTLGVLVFQAWIYHQQRTLMDGQLKATERAASAAIAAQRPWIKVTNIALVSPVAVNHETQAVIAATMTIENIGNTPALRVIVQTKVCFDYGALEQTIVPLRAEAEQFWRMARGSIVFPKETLNQNVRIWAKLPELPLAAVTILAGTVCYQFGDDVGTTTFAYSLTHRVQGPHFIRHLQFQHGKTALESDIVIERIRFMGNDAT